MKLFRKPNSRFYWYDFTVRGHRYRRSTQETKLARAAKAASVKLGSVIEGTDPFPSKPSVLSDFAERFDTWVEDGRLEKKTKKFYRNGWRLLKATPVAGLRVDQITGDLAEQLKFPGSAANANFSSADSFRNRRMRSTKSMTSSSANALPSESIGTACLIFANFSAGFAPTRREGESSRRSAGNRASIASLRARNASYCASLTLGASS